MPADAEDQVVEWLFRYSTEALRGLGRKVASRVKTGTAERQAGAAVWGQELQAQLDAQKRDLPARLEEVRGNTWVQDQCRITLATADCEVFKKRLNDVATLREQQVDLDAAARDRSSAQNAALNRFNSQVAKYGLALDPEHLDRSLTTKAVTDGRITSADETDIVLAGSAYEESRDRAQNAYDATASAQSNIAQAYADLGLEPTDALPRLEDFDFYEVPGQDAVDVFFSEDLRPYVESVVESITDNVPEVSYTYALDRPYFVLDSAAAAEVMKRGTDAGLQLEARRLGDSGTVQVLAATGEDASLHTITAQVLDEKFAAERVAYIRQQQDLKNSATHFRQHALQRKPFEIADRLDFPLAVVAFDIDDYAVALMERGIVFDAHLEPDGSYLLRCQASNQDALRRALDDLSHNKLHASDAAIKNTVYQERKEAVLREAADASHKVQPAINIPKHTPAPKVAM
ncbi:MAG: hypothetical protein FWF45_00675 [Coriobacteriia bacterium]|nr:hypothetical protein [Coriobacteriia bacterium]